MCNQPRLTDQIYFSPPVVTDIIITLFEFNESIMQKQM